MFVPFSEAQLQAAHQFQSDVRIGRQLWGARTTAVVLMLTAAVVSTVTWTTIPALAQDNSSPTDPFPPNVIRQPKPEQISVSEYLAKAGTMRGYQRHRALDIPAPIDKSQWLRYADMLTLSEPQRKAWDELYSTYWKANIECRREHTVELWQRSAEMARGPSPSVDEQMRSRWEKLLDDRDVALLKLAAMENRIFDMMTPVLSEAQLISLQRVRDHRERQRVIVDGTIYPAARLDLTDFVYAMRLGDQQFDAAVSPDFEQLLLEYERVMTPALRRFRADYYDIMQDVRRALGEYVSHTNDETRDQLYSVNRKLIDRSHNVCELNLRYAVQLADTLPAPEARKFLNSFYSTVFAVIFPDPFDVHSVFDTAAKEIADGSDIEQAIELARDEYERSRTVIHQQMIDRYLESYADRLITLSHYSEGDFHDAYERDIIALQQQRHDNAKRAVQMLLGVCPPDIQDIVQQERDRVLQKSGRLLQTALEDAGMMAVRWPESFE